MPDTILLVEDEAKLARFVELELSHEGYQVEKAFDGRTGLQMAQDGNYALILLDVMLPSLNGLEVLRRLRREKDTPVILLTARDSVIDKVNGLDTGADDYVTKPFEIEELLARIRVAIRRNAQSTQTEELLCAGELCMDRARYAVTYAGKEIALTRREFTLLQVLMENRDIVLTRESLLDKVWGYDYLGETNVVDVYIRYLRTKIDETFGCKFIHTIRGVGYVLRESTEEA